MRSDASNNSGNCIDKSEPGNDEIFFSQKIEVFIFNIFVLFRSNLNKYNLFIVYAFLKIQEIANT